MYWTEVKWANAQSKRRPPAAQPIATAIADASRAEPDMYDGRAPPDWRRLSNDADAWPAAPPAPVIIDALVKVPG